MAFPVATIQTVSKEASDTTTHNVSLGTGFSSGDTIGVITSINGGPTVTDPSGWTRIKLISNTGVSLYVLVKISDGTETSIAFTTSVAETSVSFPFYITGSGGVLADVEISTGATASTNQPDPDSVTASWGSDDNLFMQVEAIRRSGNALTSFPTNYNDNQSTDEVGSGASGCSVGLATRNLVAASDDPGLAQVPVASEWQAATLVFRPALVATITTVIPDPVVTGGEITLNGTVFGTEGVVTQEQGAISVTLSQTSYADIEIVVDSAVIESTQLKYGVQTAKVDPTLAASGTKTFVANPPTDNAFVDLTSVATSGLRITAIPDLAANDQIRYEALLQQGGSPTIFTVVVNADATFSVDGATPDGSFIFEVRAWDDSDQTWGTAANQVVTIGIVDSTSTQAMVDHLISLGFTGGIADLQMQWLESLGFSIGSLNDRWKAMMDAEPIAADGMSERKRAFYETLVGSSPNLSTNELKRAYWLIR